MNPLLYGYLIIVLAMIVVWGIYRFLNNPAVVDVAWGVLITALGFYWLGEHISVLFPLLFVLFLWGARLSLYLGLTRVIKGYQDRRYETLNAEWQTFPALGYFINFQIQAMFIVIIALPFYAMTQSMLSLTMLQYVLLAGICLALLCEALSDNRLYLFKKSTPKGLCDKGFWAYSRHPNYFFEWLIWFLFATLAYTLTFEWWVFLSPLTLYCIMNYITIPLTEKVSIEKRGSLYLTYIERTPRFFPFKFINNKSI